MKPTANEQNNILSYIRTNIDTFQSQSNTYREQMLEIYRSLSTFELPDTGDNLTRFKVNKMHEILRKVVPRVIANPPKFIVTPATDKFYEGDEDKVGKEREKMLERNERYAKAAQEYLNIVFKDQNFVERLKYLAIYFLTYGNAFAQVVPKYKVQRSKDGNKKVTEKAIGVTPSLDIPSWTEMYYDARYRLLEDMPGLLRVKKRIRLQDIYFNENYFNLDKIHELAGVKYLDADRYAESVFSITGISDIKLKQGIDANNLDLQEYQGKFSLSGHPKDERIYKITTINSAVVIGLEEITDIEYIDVKGHEDPEVFYSVGLLAPIIGLQDELNYQKNAHATAISKALHRSYYWSPESGVDPSQLISDKAGNIIVCTDGVEQAQRNLVEQPNNPLPSQYFSNINDYNRDIQSLSHTTDVTQQQGSTALTNTATGARISFFESNSVIAELRKNFERSVGELAYKLLDWTVNNTDKNIVIKKMNDKEFFKINIGAIKNAMERYDIRVEANSSSFDDLENRRADAIAIKNLILEAINAGVSIDAEEGFRKVFNTFEQLDTDTLIKKPEQAGLEGLLGEGQQQGNIPSGKEQAKPLRPTTPAGLTEAVAGGQNLFPNM